MQFLQCMPVRHLHVEIHRPPLDLDALHLYEIIFCVHRHTCLMGAANLICSNAVIVSYCTDPRSAHRRWESRQ